ncbi:MAG: hypothetical protein EAY81_11310 [Bacteroidetes bacterium]|nr:MAG: hypothetical protein EAY81_11310 [Bacteroidota bacterium]
MTVPTLSFGQYNYGFLKEHFFSRQPSTRAEAMGRAYASVDGDLTTVYFNPAGIATIKGIEINGAYTPPGYYYTEGYYRFFAAGYRINKYLQTAYSQFHFDLGKTKVVGGNITAYSQRNTLTISSEPIKNLSIGLNTNYFIWQPGVGKTGTSIYLDFGAIKKFQFLQKETSAHSVSIGASIANFNNSKVSFSNNNNDLPVTARLGANYQFYLDKHILIDTLKTFCLLFQGEYQELLNSNYETAIRTGGEIMLLEILSIRAGYYKEKGYNYGLPSVNNDQISALTYGFGLQIPLNKLTKVPLNIKFDYTSLPQSNSSKVPFDYDNFTTYNLRLNWMLKTKQ